MLIDAVARKNLELEHNLRDNTSKGTLIEVIDETTTAMGGRMLRSWLRQPLKHPAHIKHRLDVVSAFLQEYLTREDLRELLRKITDIERIVVKVAHQRAVPRDLVRLAESLQVIPEIQALISNLNQTTTGAKLQPLEERITGHTEPSRAHQHGDRLRPTRGVERRRHFPGWLPSRTG